MPALTPEQEAREQIDKMLQAPGWQVQTRQGMNRTAALGVAVCEFPLTTGEVDYMLFARGRPIGVVEAKPAGTPLSGVEPQTIKYCEGLPEMLRPLAWHDPLPFRYASTGVETYFADDRDPDARSRRVFTFHRPETLLAWVTGRGASRSAPTATAPTGRSSTSRSRTAPTRTAPMNGTAPTGTASAHNKG
jgi:type I restriction enzyme R subunit